MKRNRPAEQILRELRGLEQGVQHHAAQFESGESTDAILSVNLTLLMRVRRIALEILKAELGTEIMRVGRVADAASVSDLAARHADLPVEIL